VTDANLVLGRIRPEDFPRIFGPHNDEPLDSKAAQALFEVLAAEINAFLQHQAQQRATPFKPMTIPEARHLPFPPSLGFFCHVLHQFPKDGVLAHPWRSA
jgi:hypothetical protein